VDTNGLLMAMSVTPASVQEREGAREVLLFCKGTHPRLERVWADGGYRGPFAQWVSSRCGFRLQIVAKPTEQKGFAVSPRRWVVEWTFAWLGKDHRLSKDYEARPESSEAMIRQAMIHIMLRKLKL